MAKLVMLISCLVWTVPISAAFGYGSWNHTFGPARDDVGKEQVLNHRNFSHHHSGHYWSNHKDHDHHHGPSNGQNYRPYPRPPFFNQEDNTTTVWPTFEQATTTSKYVPLVNSRPGSSAISQNAPVLNLTETQPTTTQRPTVTQELSLQAEITTSGGTATGTTTTPKPSIQHNSDDDYDWSALGLGSEGAVENRVSGTKPLINRKRCRKCRRTFLKNLG